MTTDKRSWKSAALKLAFATIGAFAASGAALAEEPFSESGGPTAVLKISAADRWLSVAEEVLLSADAEESVGPLLLASRTVLAAGSIDASRPVGVVAEVQTDREAVARSIRLLVPVTGRLWDTADGRLHVSEEGVRLARDDERSANIFAASIGGNWGMVAQDGATVSPDQRRRLVDIVSEAPQSLAALTIGDGVLPTEEKARIVRQIELSAAEGLRRGPEEPTEVYVLRSELQTTLTDLLIEAVRSLESVSASADASNAEITASVALEWDPQRTVGRELGRVEPLPSAFAASGDPLVAAASLNFRLPPRARMQLERWTEAAGRATVKLLGDARRDDLSAAVRSLEATLSSWLERGEVQLRLEALLAEEGPYAVAALNLLTADVLQEAATLAGESTWMRDFGPVRAYRFQDESDPASPFGADARVFVLCDDRQTWTLIGREEQLPAIAARMTERLPPISDRRPPTVADALLDVRRLVAMQESLGEKPDDGLAAIAERIDDADADLRLRITSGPAGLLAELISPPAVTQAVVRAIVENDD